jgi:hypothetical protein
MGPNDGGIAAHLPKALPGLLESPRDRGGRNVPTAWVQPIEERLIPEVVGEEDHHGTDIGFNLMSVPWWL